MTGIPDEMLDAARAALAEHVDVWPEQMRAALQAALDAAPTVDGWWCAHWEILSGPNERDQCAMSTDCPGPHKTLLLGPTIGDD